MILNLNPIFLLGLVIVVSFSLWNDWRPVVILVCSLLYLKSAPWIYKRKE